jgi:uncharacterized protein YjdB
MARDTKARWASRLLRWGVLLLAACGWNTLGPSSCVQSVTVSPAAATISVGQTVQLYGAARDTAGNVIGGETISWESDNTAVATVDQTGLVKGVAVGQTAVRATSEGQSGSAAITVIAARSGAPGRE